MANKQERIASLIQKNAGFLLVLENTQKLLFLDKIN